MLTPEQLSRAIIENKDNPDLQSAFIAHISATPDLLRRCEVIGVVPRIVEIEGKKYREISAQSLREITIDWKRVFAFEITRPERMRLTRELDGLNRALEAEDSEELREELRTLQEEVREYQNIEELKYQLIEFVKKNPELLEIIERDLEQEDTDSIDESQKDEDSAEIESEEDYDSEEVESEDDDIAVAESKSLQWHYDKMQELITNGDPFEIRFTIFSIINDDVKRLTGVESGGYLRKADIAANVNPEFLQKLLTPSERFKDYHSALMKTIEEYAKELESDNGEKDKYISLQYLMAMCLLCDESLVEEGAIKAIYEKAESALVELSKYVPPSFLPEWKRDIMLDLSKENCRGDVEEAIFEILSTKKEDIAKLLEAKKEEGTTTEDLLKAVLTEQKPGSEKDEIRKGIMDLAKERIATCKAHSEKFPDDKRHIPALIAALLISGEEDNATICREAIKDIKDYVEQKRKGNYENNPTGDIKAIEVTRPHTHSVGDIESTSI